jgi:hypothetical protein
MMTISRAAVLGGALFLLAAGPAFGQQADVVYLEGYPELRPSGGRSLELDFGDLVRPGDSVVTGRTDFVELEQGSGNTIRVAADTVFTLQEVEEDGETQTVLSTAVGSVAFRFNQITGREPRLATPATVAGVRGTELTVYAGSDGSALFLVDSGLVDVEAAGTTVSLTDGEGVEVPAGGPPGEKFEWLGRELDFSTWNQERIDEFLEDPVAGARRIQERLRYFQEQIDVLWPEYERVFAELESARAEYQSLRDAGRTEAAQQYTADVLRPLTEESGIYAMNSRYYALSALSLRRFVLGKMYTELKAAFLLRPADPAYTGFLIVYDELLSEFEAFVVPRLVPADI